MEIEDLIGECLQLIILLFGLFILLELKISILNIGWIIFVMSYASDFLDEFISMPEWVEYFSQDITSVVGLLIIIYGFYIVLNGRKRIEEKLRYLSFHDALTNVYNRTYFEEKIKNIEEKG